MSGLYNWSIYDTATGNILFHGAPPPGRDGMTQQPAPGHAVLPMPQNVPAEIAVKTPAIVARGLWLATKLRRDAVIASDIEFDGRKIHADPEARAAISRLAAKAARDASPRKVISTWTDAKNEEFDLTGAAVIKLDDALIARDEAAHARARELRAEIDETAKLDPESIEPVEGKEHLEPLTRIVHKLLTLDVSSGWPE